MLDILEAVAPTLIALRLSGFAQLKGLRNARRVVDLTRLKSLKLGVDCRNDGKLLWLPRLVSSISARQLEHVDLYLLCSTQWESLLELAHALVDRERFPALDELSGQIWVPDINATESDRAWRRRQLEQVQTEFQDICAEGAVSDSVRWWDTRESGRPRGGEVDASGYDD